MADLIDRELNAVASDNRHFKAKVNGDPGASVHSQWMAESLRDPRAVVAAFPAEAYAVPRHFARILPRSLCDALDALFTEVRGLNTECEGLRVGEADELLTDVASRAVREGLRDVYGRIADHRLARRNPRDARDPFSRFQRVYGEVLPPVDAVLNLMPSAHAGLMMDANDYLAWHLYTRTWSPLVHRRDRYDDRIETRLDLPPRHRLQARHLLELYNWHQSDDLSWLIAGVDAPPVASSEDTRARLTSMAADLLAMRPFLMPNFNAARTIVQVGRRLWLAWSWRTGWDVGQLLIAADERRLLEAIQTRNIPRIAYVGRDGLLASAFLPWHRTVDVNPVERALAGNLAVLTPLYERVFEMYARIDVGAVLARFRARDATAPVAPAESDTVESTEASVEDDAVINALGTASDETDTPDLSRRVRGVRFNRFARAVEHLGCTIRQGKGSEIVVYRPGHKIARLGHHTRNPELSPVTIRVALRRLGLTLAEFVEAY